MSFSADGNTLAWAQDDGIYEANVSNPANCAAVRGSVHLVVPGGAMPFLGAASLSAAPVATPNTTILGLWPVGLVPLGNDVPSPASRSAHPVCSRP